MSLLCYICNFWPQKLGSPLDQILDLLLMEIVRDQGEKATAGWTGFHYTPTTKQTAERAVGLIAKKWVYTEVI